MELHGHVQNGVIILLGDVLLPEGTPVTVSCSLDLASSSPVEKKRVEFPLVWTGKPGSLNLTNDRIAEVFDDDDVASSRC
jgi:hypothetical protein